MKKEWIAGLSCAIVGLCFLSFIFGQSSTNKSPSEAERQVQKYGLDYGAILKEAEHDPQSVRCMFLLATPGVFDGAGSDDYAHDLMRLMKAWGDAKSVDLLQSVPATIRSHALDSLGYDAGVPTKMTETTKEWLKFKESMPKLAVMLEDSSRGRKGDGTSILLPEMGKKSE